MADVDTRALIEALDKIAKEQTLNAFVRNFPGISREIGNAVRDGTAAGARNANENADGFLNDVRAGIAATTGSVGTAIMGSADLFIRGGARLSDAVTVATDSLGQLPLVGGIAERLGQIGVSMAEYTEESVDVFQNLSRTGSGLNGQLAEFRQLAANTRMPLDQFARMVQENSEQLAAFGMGVEGGIRNFSKLSKDMFTLNNGEYVDQLYNMGYSVEEMNELLVDNISLTRRRDLQTEAQRQASIQSAINLAKQMDIVAKLTGRDAKAARDEMMERQREGATQARIRLLEKQGVEGASEAYTAAQAELASGPKVLRDLFDDTVQLGVPLTEATKNFAATNAEAYALAQQAREATARGDQVAAAEFARQAVAATAAQADSVQGLTIATMSQVSEVARGQATVLEETGPLIDAIKLNADRMGTELGRTVGFTESFNNMLQRMTATQDAQTSGAPGMADPMLQMARETELFFANSSAAVNTEIAKAFAENGVVGNGLRVLTDEVAAKLNNPQQIQETVESLGRLINGNSQIADRIEDMLANPEIYDLTEQEIERLREMQTAVEENEATISDELVPSIDRLAAQQENNEINAYITGLSATAIEQFGGVGGLEQQTLESNAAGGDQRSQEILEERERGALDYLNPMNWFEEGTYGKTGQLVQDFAKEGELAILHGREAVIPEAQLQELISTAIQMGSQMIPTVSQDVASSLSSLMGQLQPNNVAQQMGEMLPAMIEQMTTGTNTSQAGQSAMASQDGLSDMFEQLNTSLRDLTTLSSKQVDVSKRQLSTTRGLGTNVFRGL